MSGEVYLLTENNTTFYYPGLSGQPQYWKPSKFVGVIIACVFMCAYLCINYERIILVIQNNFLTQIIPINDV